MLKKLPFLLAMLILVFSFQISAQVEDSTDSDEDEVWYDRWEKEYWFDWELNGNPFIELNYGLSSMDRKDMYFGFAKSGIGEIKLGYSRTYDFYSEKVIEFNDKYFFIGKLAFDQQSQKAGLNQMRYDMWRFGFGKRSGYGYNFGKLGINLYNDEAFVWSRLDMKDFPAEVITIGAPVEAYTKGKDDTEFLNRINGTFRFSTKNEAGINISIASTIGLNAGYETTVVFPRHMFWKHLGSAIIEGAGLNLLDKFIEEVADASPYAAPIVNAVLKGAYNYAFYSLKKEKMNWPFDTESPLTYETFKFGITFTF